MKALLLAFALVCFVPLAASAQMPTQNVVAQAETYLQNLDTVKARFVQTAPDGSQAAGTFYLDRPGKLRFEYDPPVKDFVVADGVFIYFYDGQIKQQTNAPIGQTLADFLLRKNLRLSGDIVVTQVKRAGGLLQITAAQKADPNAGKITLGFIETPKLELKKWRILDSQGQITEVELFEAVRDIQLPASLFSWRDPNRTSGSVNK